MNGYGAFDPYANLRKATPKKMWRLIYTTHNIDNRGLNLEKRWCELWKCDRAPLFEEVAKYWENLLPVPTRVSDLRVMECDPRLPSDTPIIMEL